MDIPEILHWRALTESINLLKRPPSLLQDLVFKVRNPQTGRIIEVDKLTGGLYKLPFVAPAGPAAIVQKTGRETATVMAPNIRVKAPFSAGELLLERDLGKLQAASGQDITRTRDRKIATEQQFLRDRSDRTVEWMCAQALTGALTAQAGEDGNQISFTVDYGVPATHKITKSGTAVWGGAEADIPADIQAWANLILDDAGYPADTLLLGTTAADKFENDPKVQALLNLKNVNAGTLELSVGNAYMGRFKGVSVYRYPFSYTSKTGVKTKLLGPGAAVLLSSQARFTIEFGLIEDLDAGELVGEYFSKSWIEKDPSRLWLLAETHPLPVLWEPSAVVAATVVP